MKKATKDNQTVWILLYTPPESTIGFRAVDSVYSTLKGAQEREAEMTAEPSKYVDPQIDVHKVV